MVSTCFHRFESTKKRFQQALGILKKLRTVQEQERERERERGEKYLGGNLWRQEIKTPCCEDLKRKKKKQKKNREQIESGLTGKFSAQSQPHGERTDPGVSMVMMRGK